VTRAFVAVRLPDVVLDAVAERVASVSVPGRCTTRDQWHVTLQFLGDHAEVDAVVAALEGIDASGGRAQLGGAGAFPDTTRARVLWLGFADGTSVLERVAAAVVERTAVLGHEADTRPFRPHLTLARFRDPTDVRGAIATFGDEPVGPAWNVDAIAVYESERFADGARYTERARIRLPA
jgi:RNA 2',3'-cyclic 3'-phosphodiesterase